MYAGESVPDQLTNDLVASRLNQDDGERGWILDGYTLTLEQVGALECHRNRRCWDEIGVVPDGRIPRGSDVPKVLGLGACRDDGPRLLVRPFARSNWAGQIKFVFIA